VIPVRDGDRCLLIRLDSAARRDDLIRFLRARGCDCRADEASVAVDDCDRAAGRGLATLVALVEDWRAETHVGEVVLELGGERRILRTEA
jgi:hypothetical protein